MGLSANTECVYPPTFATCDVDCGKGGLNCRFRSGSFRKLTVEIVKHELDRLQAIEEAAKRLVDSIDERTKLGRKDIIFAQGFVRKLRSAFDLRLSR